MSGSTSSGANATGRFTTGNGQIRDPDGNVFTARGIAVSTSEMGAADQILASFPGLNFVRLCVYSYESPDTYAAFINTMTANHVVVEIEDHQSSDGTNQGGSRGTAFTGSQLTNELNWYSSVARAYAANPYVWFGTDNEPPASGLTEWQKQTYDAIRSTGNANPIMLELPGGGWIGPQDAKSYGLDPTVYANMSNILVDVHLYGWYSNYSTDQTVVNRLFNDLVTGAQSIPSANGTVPVIVGEYGISTEGQAPDVNAAQVFQAAQDLSRTSGAVAFTWAGGAADSLSDGNGTLTSYGRQIANWIAQGATTSAGGSTGNTIAASAISSSVSSTDSMTFVANSAAQAGTTGATTTSGGTVYVAPAAGSGMVTVSNDVLTAGGVIDLRPALAVTTWDGSAATLPGYLTVSDSPDSSIVMVANTSGTFGLPVAAITGSPHLTYATLLTHAIT